MKTHRFISRVREKAGLLKLLLGLVFLFFGLLNQVNIAVEGKTIGAIFAPFFVSVGNTNHHISVFCYNQPRSRVNDIFEI